MTTLVPPRPAPTPRADLDVSGYNGPKTLDDQLKLADMLALAVVAIPVEYRDRPADILAMILKAQELNVPIMTAIGNVHWNAELGKGALSAQLMGALLLRGGVVWVTTEITDKRVAMEFTRLDGRPAGSCDWNIGEAVAAGIFGRPTWQHYPVDMLYARCLARGARRFAQDLMLGMAYTVEELHDMTDVDTDTAPTADRPVSEQVQAVLDQLGAGADAATIRAALDHAKSAKGGRIDGDYAGDGQTLTEKLNALWLAAAARESNRHTTAEVHQQPPTVPGAAAGSAALDAPAGTGELDCGCPAASVLMGQGHIAGVCRDLD